LLSETSNFLRGLADLNTSLETAAQSSLSSTTGVDLGLQDETTSGVQLVGDLFGFFGSLGEETFLDMDIVLSHDILSLVFVEIKEPLGDIAKVLGVLKIRDESRKHKICFLFI
jgi:hypothetical protein